MWAWSAKPVSAAMVDRQSHPRVTRSHAARVRSSARETFGATPYAAANPRDTVSRAKPFASAQAPISSEELWAKSDASKSGQSFLCLEVGEAFFFRASVSRTVAP